MKMTPKMTFLLQLCSILFLSFISIDFTETLSQELILAKATGVRATAVLPFYLDGGIYTTLRK